MKPGSNQERKVIIIAGPNGAGKTTFAKEFLPQEADCFVFINADLIAAGLSPFAPESASFQAGRLMLAEIDRYAGAQMNFSFETTLSGRGYVKRIADWRANSYTVKLFYPQLSSPELAVARVRQRVYEGGHGVPEEIIRRRFAIGWRNFDDFYKNAVDEWALYDNSGGRPELIGEGTGL